MTTKTWGQDLEHEMLVSATDNCIGDTKSGEVLVPIHCTSHKTLPSPFSNPLCRWSEMHCGRASLEQAERCRALLGSWVPAPATALLGRTAGGRKEWTVLGSFCCETWQKSTPLTVPMLSSRQRQKCLWSGAEGWRGNISTQFGCRFTALQPVKC